MEGERSGAGGGEPPVEDEFACAGVLRGPLASLHGTVERLFGVTFGLGADGGASHGDGGQIWLKLRGPSGDVRAAKLFVKGLVNQEQQKEVSYPEVLHCIFCGARGLFVDGLTKNTSAHIVVDSAGFLLISGLEEPVVRAYSLITDLVERYEGAQSGHAGPGESLDSRRAFKDLVEKWEDKHFLDLLALPGSVKEVLLGLVRESGLGLSPARALADRNALRREDSEDVRTGKPFALRTSEGLPAGSGKDSAAGDSSFRCEFGDNRGRAEGAEGGAARSPPDVRAAPPQLNTKTKEEEEEEERDFQMSSGNKEFWLLLKFFTAMGYTEDVVKRVLARTGPKEASQILDVVQQEQDRSDRQQAEQSRDERNRPCETEHREEEAMEVAGDESLEGAPGDGGHSGAKRGVAGERGDAPEEDFVLGVVKKAAASCGYMEQKVAKVYNMLPDGSTRQLLLELQREVSKEKEALREGPREMDDVSPDKVRSSGGRAREAELLIPAEESKLNDKRRADPQTPHRVAPAEVKGPPMPTYPSRRHPALDFIQTTNRHGQATPRLDASPPKHMDPTYDRDPHPKHKAPQVPQPHLSPRNDPPPSGARDRRGFTAASSVVVTGEQRFLEGLLTPFDLQLTDQTGDPNVRAIIIDGSNVAMSHGLGHFFSCRGIALAVQHFWDRGHRHISALVPQWRQKSNPKIKEQHYLTELQKLGLLAYTPSREVQGKMISSYDDRFMLQHAQKTDGVIVTNDNLRDLSDESPVWRDIIKKRLLQYTFVGDHFMVPDDPLGRGGPHLDDFLRSDHRTPEPGNHSFAGASTAFPSSEPARCSQTELLNLRDRVPGGGGGGGGNRGSRRGRGKGRDAGLLQGRLAERGPEETAALREQLCQVFPGQDNMVALVLQSHPAETDINVLSDLLLEQ